MAPLLLCQQRTLKTPLSVLLVPVVLLSYAPRRSPRNRLLSCEFDSSNHFFINTIFWFRFPFLFFSCWLIDATTDMVAAVEKVL